MLMLILILTITAYIALTYHRLNLQIANARHYRDQIDAQLERRYQLFAALLQEAKKHIDPEQTILKEVVSLRDTAEQAKTNKDEKTRVAAENKISGIALHLGILFDQYTDLKTNPRCAQLLLDISHTENKLAYAKHAYNNSLEIYHANKNTFPSNLIISVSRNTLDLDFPYWEINAENKPSEQTSYSVQL